MGIILCIASCSDKQEQKALEASSVPLCKEVGKGAGKLVEYPSSGAESGKRKINDLMEYKTASGFKMRLPPFVGGLDHPNEHCEVQSGEFEFYWADGKIHPYIDIHTGRRLTKGVRIQYFVTFTPPEKVAVEKYEENIFLTPDKKWTLDGAFPILGHKKIVVLPFADFGIPELRPQDRTDRTLWRPRLLMTEVRDAIGSNINFHCGQLFFVESGNGLVVHLDPQFIKAPNSNKCMGGINFALGAGGRLDIYDPNFLDDGAPIINAVVNELNSYIVKE